MIDRAFVLVPLQAVATKFLLTLKEFPPSQTPGDWSLDTLERQIKWHDDRRKVNNTQAWGAADNGGTLFPSAQLI